MFEYRYMQNAFLSSFEEIWKEVLDNSMNPNIWQNVWNTHMEHLGRLVQGAEVTPAYPYVAKMVNVFFKHADWKNQPTLRMLRNNYVTLCNILYSLIRDNVFELSNMNQTRVTFWVDQFVSMCCPANIPFLNPDTMDSFFKSHGESFFKGIMSFWEDMLKSKLPDLTNMNHFQVGKNVATTPGWVVFSNEIFELIYYKPTTEKVYETPLLIFPPWINKFYVFDLKPENSMVRWLLDQQRSVFIISWKNATQQDGHLGFEDYMKKSIEALDFVTKFTHKSNVDTVGYCIGGTLLACVASYLEKQKNKSISSITLLTTLLDFSESGVLKVFAQPILIEQLSSFVEKQGFLPGTMLYNLFNLLKPAELIWSQFIKTYTQGVEKPDIDLLFWNGDNANIPANLYMDMLKKLYYENSLKEKKFSIDNSILDLSKISVPTYFVATEEDHITPWQGVFQGLELLSNAAKTFVLAGSGHVAGVMNPPHKQKYGFKVLNDNAQEKSHQKGSWWEHWSDWLTSHNNSMQDAFFPNLTNALSSPGTFVVREN